MGPIFNTSQFNGGGSPGSLPPVVSARDIIYDALRHLGVTRRGYDPTVEDYSDGLRQLNYLIDSWNAERMMVPAALREQFTLRGGQQTYVIGPGGDFDTARPNRIDAAGLMLNVNAVTELPLTLATREKWASISFKQRAGVPLYVYNDGGFPSSVLSVSPVPMQDYPIALYYQQALQGFAGLETQFAFPPGYALALGFNLASQMGPMMAIHMKIPPNLLALVASKANETKGILKIRNTPEVLLTADPFLTMWNRPFNIYTGE